MKRSYIHILLLFSVSLMVFLTGCETARPQQSAFIKGIHIESANIQKGGRTLASCKDKPGGCVYFDIQYPHIAHGNPKLKLAVYQWNKDFILSQIGIHTLQKLNSSVLDTTQTLVELIDDFFIITKLDLEEIKKEHVKTTPSTHPHLISFETGFQVLHNTGRLLTLQLSSAFSRDTATRNYQSILTFDTESGRHLTWEQVTDNPQVLESMITLLGEQPLFSQQDLVQSYPYTAILDTGLLLYHQQIPNQWEVEVPMLPMAGEENQVFVIPQATYQPFVKDIYVRDLPGLD